MLAPVSQRWIVLFVIASLGIMPVALLAQGLEDGTPQARRERSLANTNQGDQHIHSDSPPSAPPQSANTDPLLTCMAALADDPQFSDIAGKLPLADITHISFSMLADESLPTPKERKELADWFDGRDECWKSNEAAHEAQWPPELFQLAREGNAGLQTVGIRLYNRKISFGTANKQIQDLGNSIIARMVPIIKQYQAEIAQQKVISQQKAEEERRAADQQQQAAENRAIHEQQYADARSAQAEALRLQRAQLFLNYLQATRPAPLSMPRVAPIPRTTNTTCNRVGNSMNCTTY